MSEAAQRIASMLPEPAVVLITGRRGSGKDVTAVDLAQAIHKKTKKPVFSNYDPYIFKVPKGWKRRRGMSTPSDAIIIQSDAHLDLFAREWRTDHATAFIKFLSIARHRGTDVISTTQLSILLDRQVVATADAMIFKEPSALAGRMERGEIRNLTEEAGERFLGLSQAERWGRVVVFTHQKGIQVVDGVKKPRWFTEKASKIYGEGTDKGGGWRVFKFW